MKTIRYTPTTELLLFSAVGGLSITLYLTIGFHRGILVFSLLFAYLFMTAGVNFIKIGKGELKITYWYLIFWTETIHIQNITKIESQETFAEESDYIELVYYVFTKKYQIEYRNRKGQQRKLEFKIGNRRKKSEIVTAIKKL